jgi:hypothetical protein
MYSSAYTFAKLGKLVVRGYRTAVVRLSALVVEHCKRIALKDGWQFSDLTRAFVCIGAVVTFLSLQDPKQLDEFRGMAAFNSMPYYLAKVQKKMGPRRPYSLRRGGETALISLRIPVSLSNAIGRYAAVTGASRNRTYSRFLRQGLIIYLKADNILLKTMLALPRGVITNPISHDFSDRREKQ